MVPTIAAGTIAALFYPALGDNPVPPITSETVLNACIATGVNFLWLPPLTITVSFPTASLFAFSQSDLPYKEWSKSPHSLKFMRDAEIVMVGGGPLGKEVGDRIIEQGVRLASVWGSYVILLFPPLFSDGSFRTEVGYVVEWPPRLQGLDWQWQVPRKSVKYHFEPLGDGFYEVIIQVNY